MRDTMAGYEITDKTQMRFHALYKGEKEDGLVTVGRQDIASYMSIPAEAVEVLDLLDSGKSVGEVKRILEEKYGEEVEIEEFLQDLIENELVKSIDGVEIPTTSKVQKALFSQINGRHVEWMFSRYAMAVYAGAAVACLVLFSVNTDYIPEPRDYFFYPWYSVAVGFMFFFSWVFVAVHELAHLFAAKSVGIEGSFSISNRLAFLVAQTNLGNIWTVPREKRYIVYVAGMAWDTVFVFICLLLLFFSDHNVLTLPVLWYNFLKAIIFVKVWGIIWQFRFNMQTDVYYAVGNFFKCRNLLGDAQIYIKNFLSRFCKRIKRVDLGDMPDHEMRAVKWYSLLYVVGTFVTVISFFFRTLLVLLLQVIKAFDGITAGYQVSRADFIDGVVLIALNSFNYGLLGYVILKPRWGNLKQRFRALITQ